MTATKKTHLNQVFDLQEIRDQRRISLEIAPTAEELVALAQRCKILDIKDLAARVTLTLGNRVDLFRVEGTLKAHVIQACSVTLAPVKETINESFNEVLTTDESALAAPEDMDDDINQPVELIENDKLDIGEIIAQWLAVSLDPYPRSDAPEFAHIEANIGETGEKTHTPFSVLEKLKK